MFADEFFKNQLYIKVNISLAPVMNSYLFELMFSE